MAQPFKDPKSGNFFVSFSYRNKRYKRSTGSSSLAAAKRTQRIIDGRASQLKAGLVSLPAGVKVEEFVFDNKLTPDEPSESLTVGGFIDQYLQEAAPPAKAESTHALEKIHTGHLREYADGQGKVVLDELDRSFFEAYKRWRHSAGVKTRSRNSARRATRHLVAGANPSKSSSPDEAGPCSLLLSAMSPSPFLEGRACYHHRLCRLRNPFGVNASRRRPRPGVVAQATTPGCPMAIPLG